LARRRKGGKEGRGDNVRECRVVATCIGQVPGGVGTWLCEVAGEGENSVGVWFGGGFWLCVGGVGGGGGGCWCVCFGGGLVGGLGGGCFLWGTADRKVKTRCTRGSGSLICSRGEDLNKRGVQVKPRKRGGALS